MADLIASRRSFIGGLLVAPAIVKFGNLMPLSHRFGEISFVPGNIRDMGWVTAEFARRIHNCLLAKSPVYTPGTAPATQKQVDFFVPATDYLDLDAAGFSARYIAPAAVVMANEIEFHGYGKTVPLSLPLGVDEAAVTRARGIVARGVRVFSIDDDKMFTRLDVGLA